jgi:hypothetical protein
MQGPQLGEAVASIESAARRCCDEYGMRARDAPRDKPVLYYVMVPLQHTRQRRGDGGVGCGGFLGIC